MIVSLNKMLILVLKKASLILFLLLLSGCSYLSSVPIPGLDYIAGEEGLLRDRQSDYLEAEVLPPTQIPARFDSYIIDDLMVIPSISESNSQTFLEAPRPRLFSGRTERGVVIQRMNQESWIVVDVSPSEVWPRIQDYWTSQSIQIAIENPTRGVLDTSWFILENNNLTKEKMRVTVEPGFQNDSAEIRFLHLSIGQSLPILNQVNWPETSNDPDVEYDFLTDLSNYLADVADLYQASSVSFLAENISSRGKASIVSTPGGKGLLRLAANFDRSWAAVGRALQRADVDVVADSSELGVYEVEYVISSDSEEDEPGLLRRIATLNGLFDRRENAEFFELKVQLLDINGEIEVIVESLELFPQQSEDLREVENSLLRLIRNNLA